jgi:dTDP-4-dehydrorhamnose 3,5-epimerase
VRPTALPEVLIFEPRVFEDDRGAFFESFCARDFEAATGLKRDFVQDNHSISNRGVLRGLHYQIQHPQGKLIRAIHGEIFDVAVDLRRGSPRFGKWVGERLSEENRRQMWIPEGFGHGFLVLNDKTEVLYKTTDYWYREHERSLLWSDPAIGIDWPLAAAPTLAEKDAGAPRLADAEVYPGS